LEEKKRVHIGRKGKNKRATMLNDQEKKVYRRKWEDNPASERRGEEEKECRLPRVFGKRICQEGQKATKTQMLFKGGNAT